MGRRKNRKADPDQVVGFGFCPDCHQLLTIGNLSPNRYYCPDCGCCLVSPENKPKQRKSMRADADKTNGEVESLPYQPSSQTPEPKPAESPAPDPPKVEVVTTENSPYPRFLISTKYERAIQTAVDRIVIEKRGTDALGDTCWTYHNEITANGKTDSLPETNYAGSTTYRSPEQLSRTVIFRLLTAFQTLFETFGDSNVHE